MATLKYYDGTGWVTVNRMAHMDASTNSGTSFPASPSSGARFYRTDLYGWYVFVGGVGASGMWLSEVEYSIPVHVHDDSALTGDDLYFVRWPMPHTADVYFTRVDFAVYATATPDASNKWEVKFQGIDASNSYTDLFTAVDTNSAGWTNGQWNFTEWTTGYLCDTSTHRVLNIAMDETGNGGNFQRAWSFYYRLALDPT